MISHNIKSGDDSAVEIPVPIPNTEVKHCYGEDSWACPCENSKLPVFLCLTVPDRLFYFISNRYKTYSSEILFLKTVV